MNLSSLLAPTIHGMKISYYISKLIPLDQIYLALNEVKSGTIPTLLHYWGYFILPWCGFSPSIVFDTRGS